MSAGRPPPPTIDDVAASLLLIAQAIGKIADALDPIVDALHHATVLPEEAADLLNDAGQTLIGYSRALMREANERSRPPGAVPLTQRPSDHGKPDERVSADLEQP